jgi:hypothetical protein
MGEAMKDDLTVAQTIERMNGLEVTAKKLQEEGVVMRAKLLEVTEGQYDEIIPIVVEMNAFLHRCRVGDRVDAAWVRRRDEIMEKMRKYVGGG